MLNSSDLSNTQLAGMYSLTLISLREYSKVQLKVQCREMVFAETGGSNAMSRWAGYEKPTQCSIEGCDRGGPIKRGWCNTHYEIWRKHGNPIFEPPREHGTVAGYWQHYRRNEVPCGPCNDARCAYQKSLYHADIEVSRSREKASGRSAERYSQNRDAVIRQIREAAILLQNGTIDQAHRNGATWTGPELELLITRDDLSHSDLALMLGRTYYAVARKRNQLRREQGLPGGGTKVVRLAGVSL